MHIPDPYQPVALDAVPQHPLHIEMAGIGADIIYSVENFIIAGKMAAVRNIPIGKGSPDSRDSYRSISFKQFDAQKPKTGLAIYLVAVAGDVDRHLPDCVIVRGVFFSNLTDRLSGGFPERETQPGRALAMLSLDANPAGELRVEIEQNLRSFPR